MYNRVGGRICRSYAVAMPHVLGPTSRQEWAPTNDKKVSPRAKCTCVCVCSILCCVCVSRAESYRRLKLMLVGLQRKGKTTLLRTLRSVSVSRSSKTSEQDMLQMNFWEREVAMKSKRKGPVDMSTVGVSVSDWEYAPKKMFKSPEPTITFMTWDFGGQVSLS